MNLVPPPPWQKLCSGRDLTVVGRKHRRRGRTKMTTAVVGASCRRMTMDGTAQRWLALGAKASV